MIDEQTTTTNNQLDSLVDNVSQLREKNGQIIKVNINPSVRKILESFTSPFFNDIRVYINQILTDGAVYSKDANKIDDFILDWISNNEDQALPQPLQFLQQAIVPQLMGESTVQFDTSTIQNNNNQRFEPVIDEENLPSYLPKIHDIIEREVRRRVKLESKEYLDLKRKYDELSAKMVDISKMFLGNH